MDNILLMRKTKASRVLVNIDIFRTPTQLSIITDSFAILC